MASTKRKSISAETFQAVAAEMVGHPVTGERAAELAVVQEGILASLDILRSMDLGNSEPALVFAACWKDLA